MRGGVWESRSEASPPAGRDICHPRITCHHPAIIHHPRAVRHPHRPSPGTSFCSPKLGRLARSGAHTSAPFTMSLRRLNGENEMNRVHFKDFTGRGRRFVGRAASDAAGRAEPQGALRMEAVHRQRRRDRKWRWAKCHLSLGDGGGLSGSYLPSADQDALTGWCQIPPPGKQSCH